MLVINIPNIIDFDYIEPPSPEIMMRALEILHRLKAIDSEC